MKKTMAIILAVLLVSSIFVACGKPETTPASSSVEIIDPEADLKIYPEEAKLNESQLKGIVTSYAEYMTQALSPEEYKAQVRFEEDGSVHFDGVRSNTNGEDEIVPDLKVFASVKEAYAYLYHSGQVDLEGNLLVKVSEGVEEAVESAAQKAESEAQAQIDGTAAVDSSANSTVEESANSEEE